jgi:3-deoxy-7-phosphoheptulonate synthase
MPVEDTTMLFDRSRKSSGTVVNVNGVEIGGKQLVVMAGPCAVESRDQILETAHAVHRSGARILRGGAYKPRTSPYNFRGLKEEGLQYLAEARDETGLPVVTEIMDARHLDIVCRYADILQVGSRNMQNFTLLEELGRLQIPVLLKRGMSATIEEFLCAAEYILSGGNQEVILCERGIRTYETASRNTLDLNAVPILKRRTHLPVIVDPSHGTGYSWMVPHLARAAVAVGADGLIVEVHRAPNEALSDATQSLSPDEFDEMMKTLGPIAEAVGREIDHLEPAI